MKLYTEDGDFGERLILQGKWRDSFVDFMLQNDVKEISVNSANGFTGKSVKFLEKLPFLEGLRLLVYNVEDLDIIMKLENLKSFSNNCYDKTPINFARLPQLERLYTDWHEGVRSLLDHECLNWLYIERYKGRSLHDFHKLKSLRSLQLLSYTLESLEGIECLQELTDISLYQMRNLTSLRSIEKVHGLEELKIMTCRKLTNLDNISSLTNLRHLVFANCDKIESLDPIRSLIKLESVIFTDSTNITDGDLSVLMELPNLRTVSFQDRKHYSLKRNLFPPWNALS